MESLVSIILPVYNGQTFLDSAIKSILSQSYKNFELIIVNDASTDKSLEIVKKHSNADNRIVIINNEVNMNLPNCLNIGHNIAKSEFVTWTSDDNILKPDFLKTLISTIKNKHCDIVYSNYDIINEKGNFKREQLCLPISQILFGNVIGASFMYRKTVYDCLKGYDKSLHGIEDYDFWLRASLSFGFYHLEKNLYKYRQHPTSLTKQLSIDVKKKLEFEKNKSKSLEKIFDNLNFSNATRILILSINKNGSFDLKLYTEKFQQIKNDAIKFESRLSKSRSVERLESLNWAIRKCLLNNTYSLNAKNLHWFLLYQRGVLFSKDYSKKTTGYLLKSFF